MRNNETAFSTIPDYEKHRVFVTEEVIYSVFFRRFFHLCNGTGSPGSRIDRNTCIHCGKEMDENVQMVIKLHG